MRGRRRCAGWMVATLALAVGCGLPADGTARAVRSDDVPYDLLDPAPPSASASSAPSNARAAQPETYLLGADQTLVPAPTGLPALRSFLPTTTRPGATTGPGAESAGPSDPPAEVTTMVLVQLLATLELGPTPQQRAQGLGTALTPGVTIRLLGVQGAVADIEVQSPFREPSADRLPLAIGQLVLTATSVPGIEAVQLLQDGVPLAVPLPGGALTAEPLRRRDYAPLVMPEG